MKESDKLVRSKIPGLLKEKGYKLKTKLLDDTTYNTKLYLLFLQEFKESFDKKLKYLQMHYAEMLEVIRTLMVSNGVNIRELQDTTNQPIEWYNNCSSKTNQLKATTADLLQKFYELLGIKNKEVLKDQLKEIFISFKRLVKARELEFAQVELARRDRFEKLGGFNGVYLEKVVRVVDKKYSI